MLDTVVLCNRKLPFEMLETVKETLTARYGVNPVSGEVSYVLFSGKGAFPESGGTYSCTIRSSRYIRGEGDTAPVKRDCYPEILIEASLHKAMLGHNVHGGPTEWLPSIRYLLHEIGKDTGTDLLSTELGDWMVRRVDVAEVFDLGSEKAVKLWLRSLRDREFPRRTLHWWDWGLMADGSTTCLRAYAKGEEFDAVGRKQARQRYEPEEVKALGDHARRLLRIEVEIKRGLLDDAFEHIPSVLDIREDWLNGLFDDEWGKFVRESRHPEGTLVTDALEVRERLRERYGNRVGVLFPAWACMASLGEEGLRDVVSRSTFYKLRHDLEAAGVAWIGTTLYHGMAASPIHFVPQRTSGYRQVDKHPRVALIEQDYACAAGTHSRPVSDSASA